MYLEGFLWILIGVLCFPFADRLVYMLFDVIPLDLRIPGVILIVKGFWEILDDYRWKKKHDAEKQQKEIAQKTVPAQQPQPVKKPTPAPKAKPKTHDAPAAPIVKKSQPDSGSINIESLVDQVSAELSIHPTKDDYKKAIDKLEPYRLSHRNNLYFAKAFRQYLMAYAQLIQGETYEAYKERFEYAQNAGMLFPEWTAEYTPSEYQKVVFYLTYAASNAGFYAGLSNDIEKIDQAHRMLGWCFHRFESNNPLDNQYRDIYCPSVYIWLSYLGAKAVLTNPDQAKSKLCFSIGINESSAYSTLDKALEKFSKDVLLACDLSPNHAGCKDVKLRKSDMIELREKLYKAAWSNRL